MASERQKYNLYKTFFAPIKMDFKYIGGDTPWSLPFGDHFHSSNSQQNTSELATIARRHGFEPLYEQYTDAENHSKWSNAGVFFTNKTIDSDLTGIHNTDFHDDHNHTFCYLCSINQHEHEQTKPRDESKRRKLVPYKNPKARSLSSLDRTTQNPSSSSFDFISYRFVVRTGTQKNSGTRAQVFLYMYGTENNWTSIHLQRRSTQNSSASTGDFPSGSIRTFCLKGPDIGQLHHLNVNLVGSRSDKEWFLKEIEITNLNTSITWLCEFNCWLPKTDEQEINQIKPNVHRQTEFPLSIYILQTRTGDKPFAGTDANVQVTVRGSKSQTRRLALTTDRVNLFEQNQLDTFAIVGSDLGDLLEIIVESDRSQMASDWDIKEMIMWKIIPNDDHEKSQVYFPFNTWLGKKVSTLKSKREVYPSTDHHIKGPICYQVIVKTGKATNAGTDANVFMIIYGKCGRTIIHQLNNRLKNDFERNSTSEFTIMDIDIGKINQIKLWHDNSGPGSAWFLDSVIIRKKYSTCQTISTIYIKRLEEISKALHRQIRQQIKKTPTRHTSSIKGDERRSTTRHSLQSNDSYDNNSRDRLGNSRGILRSPTMYDKASLQKKVTWDEQSIGSQDDTFSMNSQRTTTMQTIAEKKPKREDDSFHHESNHFDYQAYWISSHNYIENKWKIKSIEEINTFDFDQYTCSLLLSDRSVINNKIKTSVQETDDEIYEFQANRWLAKDKEDGKLEVYLASKLIHKSSITSDTSIDSKKKHLTSTNLRFDDQRQKYAEEENLKEPKRSSPYDPGLIERYPKGLTPHDLRLSSSRLPNTLKIQPNDLHSSQRNIDPSSRPNITLKKQEESLKINSSIDKLPSSSSLTQRSKSLRTINDLTDSFSSERELLARITGEPSYHSRSTANSLISPSQHSKPSRNINERESLARIPSEPSDYSRSLAASTLSSSQHLKSPRNINDLITQIPSEREPLVKFSDQQLHHPRSSAASLLSTDQNIKSPRSYNDLTTPLINTRDSLTKISREPPNYPRSAAIPMSSSNQSLKLPRNTKDLISPLTGEQELLARITREPPYRSQSPATSLTPSSQHAKLSRNSHDLINSSTGERETLAKISSEPLNHSRLAATSSLSFNQLSKPIRLSNEPASSLTPRSAVRSNPNPSSQKSVYNQVYNSSYGTTPSDDF